MLKSFLYITIGILVGIPIPHFQTIGNALLSGNRGLVMSELAVTWQSLMLVVPLCAIIALILVILDKRNATKRKKEEESRDRRDQQRDERDQQRDDRNRQMLGILIRIAGRLGVNENDDTTKQSKQ